MRRLLYVYRPDSNGVWWRETMLKKDVRYLGRVNTSQGEMVSLRDVRDGSGVIAFPRDYNGRS
jgi:hypothetical protein